MAYRQTITDRVKFLISHLISKGIASNQEELGKKIGIESKSYLSQLVSGKQNNTGFINKLMSFDTAFNKEWLYDEAIESPFITEIVDFGSATTDITQQSPEETIKKLQHDIELLKKDVKYYADMADSRLQTIEVQSKLINQLEQR